MKYFIPLLALLTLTSCTCTEQWIEGKTQWYTATTIVYGKVGTTIVPVYIPAHTGSVCNL